MPLGQSEVLGRAHRAQPVKMVADPRLPVKLAVCLLEFGTLDYGVKVIIPKVL